MRTDFVIQILSDYSLNKARIRDIDIQIVELNSADNIVQSGNVLSERVSKTYKFSSSVENIAIEIADMIVLLEEEKKHINWMLDRIDNAINSLEETESKIVQMKYLKNDKWYVIAAEVMICERNCRRINRKALEKIAKILNI